MTTKPTTTEPTFSISLIIKEPQDLYKFLENAASNEKDFAIWELLVHTWNTFQSARTRIRKNTLHNLLHMKAPPSCVFDSSDEWESKLSNLKSHIKALRKEGTRPLKEDATLLETFIEDVDVIGRGFGKKRQLAYSKLLSPQMSYRTHLSRWMTLIAFIKGQSDHGEQSSLLKQYTDHSRAIPGSKRPGDSIDPDPKRRRLETAGKSTGPLQRDDSALDGYANTPSEHENQIQVHSLTPTPLVPDDSFEESCHTNAPNQLDPTTLYDLKYVGQEDLCGTGDTIVKYRWGGVAAITYATGEPYHVKDGNWFYLNMKLRQLPFKELAEMIMQSNMWESEKLDTSQATSCLALRLPRIPKDPYCCLDCIVPTSLVSRCTDVEVVRYKGKIA
ncbi:hypothetical protein PtrSN002B_011848 [Pyrenophora tritici-repentis]|nr:hypothetical protein PtrSN001C_012094 [Pyrenophora tritici-repentis]KAI1522145.1 hypothetical protein PtrSN001A_011881 [Pyrenophora tritici-repentis]KAI1524776.1 hypothetical protein PtrSN002B_011848 [Pyrenophora tritici-repentis]KAI1559088.1 hypothetical protein PtrEW4_011905 [Pyrenophora tritici-repentis]KAI1560335.1 hypothetical protein PtrEW7m1_011600 [Pyrenophora tritici-repentis]